MKKCPRCGREFEDTNTLCPADGAVLEKTGDALLGRTLADKYRVEELINEGGMGAVYRATHILMDKTVAVKVLHPSLAADDKIVARFSREARAASRLSHPHALNVTDFGESDGVVFLVMEYLRGRTLKEAVREDGPMPLTRAVEIMRQVSGALDAAHAEGVVHRDLKSDNIMLVDMGGGDWAKVLDFGIAKIQEPVGTQDPGLTAPNLIIGTPQYMSPEQCSQAAEIDSRSDIYSLGVILYELLAGHVPFTGDSPTAIMMKHIQEPPPSILEERRDLPAGVGRVVARAMAKRPEDRYQNAGELAENLALAADGKLASDAESAVAAAGGPSSPDRATHRIVVQGTGPNDAPRDTSFDDADEETVVRMRRAPLVAPAVAAYRPAAPQPGAAPPPVEKFNPWRVVIPSAAALLVVFFAVYALTRNPGQPANANQQAAPLVSDPNSKPVQPAPPVTGKGEQGITSNVPSSPVPAGGTNANTQAGGNQNQTQETLTAGGNENANAAARNNKQQQKQQQQNQGEQNQNEAQQTDSAADKEKKEPRLVDSIKDNKQREKPSPDASQQEKKGEDKSQDEEPPPQKKQKPALPKPTTAPKEIPPPQPTASPDQLDEGATPPRAL